MRLSSQLGRVFWKKGGAKGEEVTRVGELVRIKPSFQ